MKQRREKSPLPPPLQIPPWLSVAESQLKRFQEPGRHSIFVPNLGNLGYIMPIRPLRNIFFGIFSFVINSDLISN